MTTEHEWDKLLKIKTSGRDDSHSDTIHYPYEPTPYSVLTRLVQTGLLTKKIQYLITAPEKEEYLSIYPMKRNANPLV